MLLVVLLVLLVVSTSAQKSLQLVLRPGSGFNACTRSTTTLLAYHIAEFMGDVNLFMSYVKYLGDHTHNLDREVYDAGVRVLQQKYGNSTYFTSYKFMMDFAISSHYYLPKIVAFQSVLKEQNCEDGSVVLLYRGKQVCVAQDGEFGTLFDGQNEGQEFTFLYDYNSIKCDLKGNGSTVTLLGDYLSNSFRIAKEKLENLCRERKISGYVIHPLLKRSENCGKGEFNLESYVELQGFGVELAFKNMEYKVLDDQNLNSGLESSGRESSDESIDDDDIDDILLHVSEDIVDGLVFSRLINQKPDLALKLNEFKKKLKESQQNTKESEDGEQLKVWDIQDLGSQFIEKVLSFPSKSQFKALKYLSYNFPSFASVIKSFPVDSSIKQKLKNLHDMVEAGKNYFMLNNIPLDFQEDNIFSLYDLIREELRYSEAFHRFPTMSPSHVRTISKLSILKKSAEPVLDTRTSAEETDALVWLNDLEKDKRYFQWSQSLRGLLTPGWPNQLRYVAKNLYNLVAVIDPSKLSSLALFKQMYFFVNGNAPFRGGFVFFSKSAVQYHEQLLFQKNPAFSDAYWVKFKKEYHPDRSTVISKIFALIRDTKGLEKAFLFLDKLADAALAGIEVRNIKSEQEVSTANILSALKAVNSGVSLTAADLESLLNPSSSIYREERFGKTEKLIEDSASYIYQRGLAQAKLPYALFNGVELINGEPVDLNRFREIFMPNLLQSQQDYQRKVYYGIINDDSNVENHIYQNSVKKTNPLISKEKDSFKHLSLSSMLDVLDNSTSLFISSENEYNKENRDISILVGLNLETKAGVQLAFGALNFANLNDLSNVRIAILHSCSMRNSEPSFIEKVYFHLQEKESSLLDLVKFLKLVELYFDQPSESRENFLNEGLKQIFPNLSVDKDQTICPNLIAGLNTDLSNFILVNGRIIALPDDASFLQDDFASLVNYEIKEIVNPILELLASNQVDVLQESERAELLFAISAVSRHRALKRKTVQLQDTLLDPNNVNIMSSRNDASPIHIKAIVDPLSEGGQQILGLLHMLEQNSNFDIDFVFNPMINIENLPLKRFYRFVFSPKVLFDSSGSILQNGKAFFKRLPGSPVLTLGVVDTPEAWLVESTQALFDLDNLRLQDLGKASTLYVEYALENVLLSGHSFDKDTQYPTAGLKLQLESPNRGVFKDTVVMENLGYFQLQSNPGIWILSIAGSHNSVYELGDSSSNPNPIIISSFHPKAIDLGPSRKIGKEDVDLQSMSDDDQSSPSQNAGLWGSIQGLLFSKDEKNKNVTDEKDYIHIFSLASGHLYERFLKIMMLSVTKQTKSPVKFWFIRQFLSPQFKKEIKDYAAKLGDNVEVELATYKWPHWLRRQTEKQRTIWGYKILFLDVLFPLKVPRVIFVDADQIVRTDLKELWNMDIRGAPYAYTPFCDSNRDTEGFRFWKTGYWKDHLRGKPYHISALYLVDLLKFRKMRAGDQLRIIYDQLSSDPNSLANLDQDLPNFSQHQVPIYSLSQEWLWCETWCSMDTLSQAKTIDLCNNPLTKEPKLTRAKRFVTEWDSLDKEVSALK